MTRSGHLQPRLSPELLDVVPRDPVARFHQLGKGPSVAATGIGERVGLQPCQVLLLLLRRRFWDIALGGAVLADELACPGLRYPEPAHECFDRASPPARGQIFPAAISFNMVTSRVRSATMVFSRLFSVSSSFSRLASVAFIPP